MASEILTRKVAVFATANLVRPIIVPSLTSTENSRITKGYNTTSRAVAQRLEVLVFVCCWMRGCHTRVLVQRQEKCAAQPRCGRVQPLLCQCRGKRARHNPARHKPVAKATAGH